MQSAGKGGQGRSHLRRPGRTTETRSQPVPGLDCVEQPASSRGYRVARLITTPGTPLAFTVHHVVSLGQSRREYHTTRLKGKYNAERVLIQVISRPTGYQPSLLLGRYAA